MDWSSAFDEAYPQPGATETTVSRFVTEIGLPMSVAEVQTVNNSQQNPFPKGDALHSAWRPFDAAAWVIPNRPLPPTYLSLLRWSNGGEFRSGERWFQFFPAADPGRGVRAMLLAYHVPQYMPGALPVGMNGGGTFYLLDMRQPALGGEYPVVCASAGYLAWKPEAYRVVADAFPTACRDRLNVADLFHDTA